MNGSRASRTRAFPSRSLGTSKELPLVLKRILPAEEDMIAQVKGELDSSQKDLSERGIFKGGKHVQMVKQN